MKHSLNWSFATQAVIAIAMIGMGLTPVGVSAQPSNKPLLTNTSGARPNLMIALDNSGSMAYPFHEAYGIVLTTDVSTPLRQCAPPLYSNSPVGYTLGGTVDPARPDGQKCLSATGFDANGQPTGYAWSANNGVAYVPAVNAANSLRAQRSADLNPVYYNPRTTYAPRIGPDYLPLVRPLNPRFISNQTSSASTATFYTVYRNPLDGALYAVNVQKPAPAPVPAWATSANVVYSLRAYPFPIHVEYTTAGSGTTPAFTYTYCRSTTGASTLQLTPDGMEVGCSSVRRTPFATSGDGSVVSVFAPGHPSAAGNVIQLPSDHARTDCAAVSSCTNAEELSNVLNWYHWYSTRQLATSTAIGQSLAANQFQGRLRIGYMPINDYTLPNGAALGNTNLAIAKTPGTVTNQPSVLRGVRTLQGNTTSSTELFSFLNSIQSRGGTPLHNAISQVANYYAVPGGALENPWTTDPTQQASTSNPEMSCRRSFNLLFSDGGWTTSVAPAVGPDYDNTNGPVFTRQKTDGTTESFQYLRTGNDTPTGRKEYVPFPSTGTGGLADLTARYFWHTDLRTLDNNIATRPGQPTFWQNMTTYTVGYLIRPTGEVTGGAGLTFTRIDQYKAQYQASGYAAAVKPVWPTGNLVTTSTNQTRVDDFIHAGYTGGGRSFGARNSSDVREIFDKILSEILDSSGNDAGVATTGSTNPATETTTAKYEVSYRTLDNSGDLTKLEVDESTREETGVILWSGTSGIPAHGDRRLFTYSEAGTPSAVVFAGTFSSLPSDVRSELQQGPDASRIPTGTSFVDYLRGDDNVLDNDGRAYRKRTSKMGAIVNSAPLYVSGFLDYFYDDPERESDVEGQSYYNEFVYRKKGYPASLFVATNAGVMHAFNAQSGAEMAAYMPRRSLSRMLNFADESYNFEYVLDGPISDNDIYDNRLISASTPETEKWKGWRQLAIGTGGRGEPLVYAVNSPFKSGATPSRIPDKDDYLWETGPDKVNAVNGGAVLMGYPSNSVRTGQTEIFGETGSQRGHWIAAVNNGHYNGESDGSNAGLVVLNSKTGEVIRTIPLPNGYSAGRGLSGVTLVRSYTTHVRVVAAYAGDANGNLWRFDLSGEPSTWHVTYDKPIFTVPSNRPIYGHPAWQPHPLGGFIVVFSTGMALEENDLTDLGDQSHYAVWDKTSVNNELEPGFQTIPATSLVEQTVLNESAYAPTSDNGTVYFKISNNVLDWNVHRGWKMKLGWRDIAGVKPHIGERTISDIQNFSTSVIITTTVLRRDSASDDVEMCTVSAVPENYIYAINALTGRQSMSYSFDVPDINGVRDQRADEYAVAYKPNGGFSRGFARSFPTETPVLPDNSSDPRIVESFSDRQDVSGVEAHGESPRPPGTLNKDGGECEKDETIVSGTTGTVNLYVGCKIGWSRTQYQLSAPPSN